MLSYASNRNVMIDERKPDLPGAPKTWGRRARGGLRVREDREGEECGQARDAKTAKQNGESFPFLPRHRPPRALTTF